MQYWENKVAIVTDCGDDYGVAIIEELAQAGMIVISFNKDEEVLERVREQLKPLMTSNNSGKVILQRCDVTNIKQLKSILKYIEDTSEGADVLINNTSCNKDCLVSTGNIEDFQQIIDINILNTVVFIRLVAASMIKRQKRGHIIHMNDLSCYQLPLGTKKSVFVATKVAVSSINEILRHEFRYLKSNIKVTNVACGRIERFEEEASDKPRLKTSDIAKLVKEILDTPENLQLHEVLVDYAVE